MSEKSSWGGFFKKTAAEFTANVIKTALSEHYKEERRRVVISAAARTLLQKFGVSEAELSELDKQVAQCGKKVDIDKSVDKTDVHTADLDKKALDADTRCAICMESPRTVLFLPCRHLQTCAECADRISTCCICRGRIDERINVFM